MNFINSLIAGTSVVDFFAQYHVPFLLLVLVAYVLYALAYWRMFEKAGERPWKALIPGYHLYVAFKLAWKDGTFAFWVAVSLYVISCIILTLVGAAGEITVTVYVLFCVAMALRLMLIGLMIVFYIRQAQSYGRGIPCGVLAAFFPNVMTLYYGFSSVEYQGQQ